MPSIRESLDKIKTLRFPTEKALLGLIIVLVGTAAFGLGRLSVEMGEHQPIKITSANSTLLSDLPTDPSDPSYQPQNNQKGHLNDTSKQ